jgi:hypothetical protein
MKNESKKPQVSKKKAEQAVQLLVKSGLRAGLVPTTGEDGGPLEGTATW